MSVTRRPPSFFKRWASAGRSSGRRPARRGGFRGRFFNNLKIPSGKTSSNMMTWRGPGFIPQQYYAPFDYITTYKMTDATGFYDWVFRASSLYDPDNALGGDSVTGLSGIAELYTHYKVLGCRVSATVVNLDTDDPVTIVLVPNTFDSSYAVANKLSMEGQPYARGIVVANQAGAGSISSYMSTKVMHGVTNLDSVNFGAEVTTNPATNWYWHLVAYNLSGNALNCEVKLHAIFYTVMSSMKAFTQ